MTVRRKIEIFTAGCPVCLETIELINGIACPSCEITVLDMHDPKTARHARTLGVRSVPAVAIDGVLASCCAGRGVDADALRASGIGQPLG